MNKHETSNSKGDQHHGDDALESLFRHADVRPRPPSQTEQDIRSSLHEEWHQLTGRNRRRKFAAWGLAASVLLAALLLLMPQRPATMPTATLAGVTSIEGELLLRAIDEPRNATLPFTGESLSAGQVLITDANSRAGLTWASGESIRLDRRTELALISENLLELRNGTVYVDSQDPGGEGFVIRTPAGDVRHIGTQYIANVNKGTLTVSVREGKVQVLDETADQGQQLTVNQRGQVATTSIDSYGPLWSWAEILTPRIILDGMSAQAFVEWAARQTGREVEFVDDETRQLAASTLLRGTIETEPARALELILQTSDLDHEIIDGKIEVRIKADS